jgi:ABC-type uncharacterized transport system substrate-binding protein
MMIEDHGLDEDADGQPESARLTAFAGTDVDWESGFPGDLYVRQDGAPLALEPPVDHRAWFEDDRVFTSHLRPLTRQATPESGPISLRVYDPTYFVAYDMRLPLTVEGRAGCDILQLPADLATAYDRVEEILYGPESVKYQDPDSYPEVGDLFADELKLTCAAG